MVHVKYPSMERQDLTQGQLGSFKFTPVDEAPPSPHPHPLLLQQYNQSLQNAGFFGGSAPSHDAAHDSSFFNQQIRPSLDAARPRFAPATVRVAGQGASTSPKKRFGHRAQGAMRPNAQDFHPYYPGSESDSLHSIYTSEGNTTSLSLTPSNSNTGDPVDFANAHSSVLRALETEQTAHVATQSRLEQEISARREAEAETARLAECNKGLLNSVNLLKSTVRHMVKKENDNSQKQMSMERAVKEFKREAHQTNSTNSILYDVLSNYKNVSTTAEDGGEISTVADDDLLSAPVPVEELKNVPFQPTLQEPTSLNFRSKNVSQDISVSQADVEPNVSLLYQTSSKEHSLDVDAEEGFDDIEGNHKTLDAQANAESSLSSIMLELPAWFLKKYNKKRADEELEELPPLDTPRKTNITSVSAIKPSDYDMDGSGKSKPPNVIWLPDSPEIAWKIDNRHRDELRGNRTSVQTRTVDSHFVDYPLRYIPNILDDNLYRTVMIDFIPIGTPYSDVLDQIRGGTLELIQLYGPVGNVTDFVTARVIYTDENGATALYRRGQDPGIKINGTRVRVWQILEATYPKNKELEKAIYVHKHTRILAIHAPIVDINDLLKRKLRSQIEAGLVLDIGRSHDGGPFVEFTTIEESTKALEAFLDDKDFAGADFDFDEDPCNSRFSDELLDDE